MTNKTKPQDVTSTKYKKKNPQKDVNSKDYIDPLSSTDDTESESYVDPEKFPNQAASGKPIIDKSNGKVHKGYKNLKPFKKGEMSNPRGKLPGTLSYKNRLKRDLQVMKWMQEDPELAELVNSLDNKDMFDTLKQTAFATFVKDPGDPTLFDRAYKAVAEDREYTEGKKTRTEVDQRVTKVSEMTIEQLEAELEDITDIEPTEVSSLDDNKD